MLLDPQAPDFKPHNYPRNRVAYTGTHDTDTLAGWMAADLRDLPQRHEGRQREQREQHRDARRDRGGRSR